MTASGSFAYAATFLDVVCCRRRLPQKKDTNQHTPRVIRLQSAMIRNTNVKASSTTQYKCHVQFFAANLSHSKECVWPLLHATAQTFLWAVWKKLLVPRSYKINAQDVICSLNMALLFVRDSGAGKIGVHYGFLDRLAMRKVMSK